MILDLEMFCLIYIWFNHDLVIYKGLLLSGVAVPGPTRACSLPSTSQALPSPGQPDSCDFDEHKEADVHPYMASPAVLTILLHFRSISVIPGYAPDDKQAQIN